MKHVTSLCISVAQAEEGARTKMATVAANGNLLDLFDRRDAAGQVFKGDHLCNRERAKARYRNEKKVDTRWKEVVLSISPFV